MVAAVLAGLLVAGCSGSGEPAEPTAAPTMDLGSRPTPSASPTGFAVPDDIDQAYVQRVLDALADVRAEAVRRALQAGASPGATMPPVPEVMPTAVTRRMGSVYADFNLETELDRLHTSVYSTEGRQAYPDPYTGVEFRVQNLAAVRPDCIITRVRNDFTGEIRNITPPAIDEWVVLVLKQGAGGFNPTPWKIYQESLAFDPHQDRSGPQPEPSQVCP